MSVYKKDVQLQTGGIPVDTYHVYLGLDVDGVKGQFRYSLDGKNLDVTILSDEAPYPMGFTKLL